MLYNVLKGNMLSQTDEPLKSLSRGYWKPQNKYYVF